MRLLHPPLLAVLIIVLPVAAAKTIECLNYRVPMGEPIPKAIRNPKCSSRAEHCVKITGNTADGNSPFIAGRCEYPDECKETSGGCFSRTDDSGKNEEVCCSTDDFSNHGSSTSVITFIAVFISLIILSAF